MSSSQHQRTFRPDPVGDRGDEPLSGAVVWNEVLHEFRNHLTVIMAATSELRSELPPSLAFEGGEALTETERSVEGLTALVALVDASIRTAEPIVCDLDSVFERAVRFAAPAVGRRVSVSVSRGERIGIKNRGSALECLLAALIVDLGRAPASEGAPPPRVSLRLESSRGSLAIEVESDGASPPPGSWRVLLARDLARKLGATILFEPEAAAYVVQFR